MPSRLAITFFVLATLCYFAAWTDIAVGLAILGVVFEACMYITLLGERKDKNDRNQ